MAALTIISCSSAAVGAAEVKPCPQIKVICQNGSCGDINALLAKYCGKNCNLNQILKNVGGYCPGGNCSVNKPYLPTAKPTEPVVNPTEPAVPPQTDSAEFNTAYEAQVLRLVNAERAKYGLSPFVKDSGATQVAHLRAKEIVQSFSHTRPNGQRGTDIIPWSLCDKINNSKYAAENIAMRQPTCKIVMKCWYDSKGHRENMLNPNLRKVGIAGYKYNGVMYWVQLFAS